MSTDLHPLDAPCRCCSGSGRERFLAGEPCLACHGSGIMPRAAAQDLERQMALLALAFGPRPRSVRYTEVQ